MAARIPQSVREEQLDSLPGKRFVRWDGTYKNNLSKAVMRCDKYGHEWSATITNLIDHGYGCPKCANNKAKSASEREAELNCLPGMMFVRWDDDYKNSNSKALMRCENFHEWSASAHSLLNKKSGCPKCAGKHRHSSKEREIELNALGGKRFVRWVNNGYVDTKSRAVMACDCGHEWSSSVNNLLNNKRGCPKCAKNYRYSRLERESALNSLNGMRFIRWEKHYVNSDSKAFMMCDAGHCWPASVNKLLNCGRGCPSCAKSGFDQGRNGTLYALRSNCGRYIKIGKSNRFDERLLKLRRSTPFSFEPISVVEFDIGSTASELEKLFHHNFKSAGMTGFDGATEWLKFDSTILDLMNLVK